MLIVPERIGWRSDYSGIDSLESCIDRQHFLNYSKKIWATEIDCIRQERTERYNTLQELAAESIYYDLPWSWGGPFYRGFNGWNGFYGYSPYDIWPFSGSMIGN